MWVKLLKILVYIRYILPPVISKCVSSDIFPWSVFFFLTYQLELPITWVTVAKVWKRPKCPLTGEWTRKCCRHTTEYYSGLKKEILRRVTRRRTQDAERNEPVADGQVLRDSTSMRSERVKLIESKTRGWVPGAEKREESDMANQQV